ncbi:hypothetical protein [Paraburkholderia acidisoli]|uniref:Type IV pilus assembly protein PilV n=1 Tax=Paraburkholderia acidisoli TaxID=2571748 RepID=A0A7Z2GIQ1_9BURK|nr:hypothetical protein [Paraburkholderia acidisoli]QGZ62200.1 hypothetical protein FAZ98_10925 [Paraburkholderia acidisoli]
MKRPNGNAARGSTLLEVAIALGIMALCGLGLINTQLGLARHAQLAAARERAAFAADALAESACLSVLSGTSGTSAATGAAAAERWKTLASGIVPEGKLTAAGVGGDVSVASLTWRATSFMSMASAPAVSHSASCAEASVPAGRDCLAVAFLR